MRQVVAVFGDNAITRLRSTSWGLLPASSDASDTLDQD